ncbi:P-loop containing nucleoside triphosphate hydrolase protein, partial [Cantharellus anzutake]|uniref:P-loop containing nucleoside triphosphate hydrolase protein n=1 Tax=Cantharellus anzutake TaxID=1750568 RepID=UPI0019060AB3
RSNDRGNLHYCVKKMVHSKDSYLDLAFLVPLGLKAENPIPVPFLVYCNSREDARLSAEYLQSRVSRELRKKIVWVHSSMSDEHKIRIVQQFNEGNLIGLTSTETLGLGHDLVNVTRLVQFCPPDNLSTLTQRFGRAARDPCISAVVILLAPKDYFQDTHQERAERARKAAATKKHK